MDVLVLSPSVAGSVGPVVCPCGTSAEAIQGGFRHVVPGVPVRGSDVKVSRYVDHFSADGVVIDGWTEQTGRTLVDPFGV